MITPSVIRRLAILVVMPGALAAGHFDEWPTGASPKEAGLRVTENFLARPHMMMPPDGVVHYAEVCTWIGALSFAQANGSKELTARLVERFEPLYREERHLVPEPKHVDWTVFGSLPLEIYMQTGDMRGLALGEWMAQRQWGKPFGNRIEERAAEFAALGHSWQTRLWIDDMFMITAIQSQAFRATGDRAYIDRAAREMVFYLDELQKPNGLFFHTPDAPFFWGRGNGWMAAGMANLLRWLPADNPDRARIMDAYRLMMATLLEHQADSGMWLQLIDGPDSWPETSSTAMFTFAFIAGVKEGWLDADIYGPAARRAWLALVTHLDADANLREVCVGTGARNDRQHYLDRPRAAGDFHGQAPLLWCASALVR
ncbi:MAG TPA: glycoside hydrolase family 88 protein [Opitutaceae bacterium]|nr:glycoside hydrolase family 88 protein [Opitutaceae bacterium]